MMPLLNCIYGASEIQGIPAGSWLGTQPCPVIVYGAPTAVINTDVLVSDLAAARFLEQKFQASPMPLWYWCKC